jgi:hypothetical protein
LNSLHTTVATPRKKCGLVLEQKPFCVSSTVTNVSCGGSDGEEDWFSIFWLSSISPPFDDAPPSSCPCGAPPRYNAFGWKTACTPRARSFARSPSLSRG